MTPESCEPPEFSLSSSRALGTVVVHVEGPLDTDTSPRVAFRLAGLVDAPDDRQVVLDLRRTTIVDFAGFLVLVEARRRLREVGGDLVLSGPSRSVRRALAAAGLDEAFLITPAWDHPARGGRHTLR